MNSKRPFKTLLARVALYLVLILGAVGMVFPFFWMIVTSFQSRQESLSNTPVWFPERLNIRNWDAATRLGAQGGSSLWGGLAAGKTVTLELTFKNPEHIVWQPVVEIPDSGRSTDTSNMFSAAGGANFEPRKVSLRRAKIMQPGVETFDVFVQNSSTNPLDAAGLKVTLKDGIELLSSSLAPDSRSRSDAGTVLEWNTVSPGLLGYVLENYRSALKTQVLFGRYFLNSFLTALSQVGFGLLVCSMAAFAFARIEFRGREVLFAIILSSLVIPGEMLLVPNFVTVFRLGWTDSYPGLVVPWVASVFGIFLLRQFFLSLPAELFEAAKIDGAGYGTQFLRLGLPLAVPGLVTYGIFAFLGSWNSLLWPLIITNKPEMRTLQVGLQAFIGEAGVNYGQLMAASIMVVAPIMIGFLLAQKQFIAGVARSGLK
jgi:multiple sugar transport system permease protein